MKNSKKKTYGAHGLMEWYCRINCGGTSVNLPFKGGTISGTGSTPAKYTTENPLLQAIIENSEHFRSGRIVLISVVDGSGRYKIAEPGDKPAPKEEDESPEGNEPAGEPTEGQEADSEDAGDEGSDEGSSDVTKVEVASLDDAKAYLVDNHGCKASELRSKAKIVAAAKERGIEFIGI